MDTQPITTDQQNLPVGVDPRVDPLNTPASPVIPPTSPARASASAGLLPIILSSLVTALILVGVYFLFLNKSPKNTLVDSTPNPNMEFDSPPVSTLTPEIDLPQGWAYQSTELCDSSIAMPPVTIDKDNRKWVVERGEDQPFGLWKGQAYRVIHRNPEEASGFISGMVSMSCGQTTTGNTSDKLAAELSQYLDSEKSKNNDSEFIIQIQSSKNIEKWGNTVNEITFTGGMYDTNQKYYLFTKDNNWFLITSKSDSLSPIINQQTQQIFDLLKFD